MAQTSGGGISRRSGIRLCDQEFPSPTGDDSAGFNWRAHSRPSARCRYGPIFENDKNFAQRDALNHFLVADQCTIRRLAAQVLSTSSGVTAIFAGAANESEKIIALFL